MNMRTVTVDGIEYRGPMGCSSGNTPWRITAFLPSSRRSTSGQVVGRSWQTWKKFTCIQDCEDEMQALEERAKEALNAGN